MSKVLTIWKYPLKVAETQVVEMPKGSEIISAMAIGEDNFIWARVDAGEPKKEIKEIRVIGTSHPIQEDEKLRHIGTTTMMDNKLIWHIFEVLK